MGALNKNPMSLSTENSRKPVSDKGKRNKETHSLVAKLDTTVILPHVHCLIASLRKAKHWSCH